MAMRKSIIILFCLYGYCCGNPLAFKRNIPILQKEDEPLLPASDAEKPAPDMTMISTLTLPSNATSIRADITDNFSCENRLYGYYADVENECQIFHVCLPVTYADGKENTYRWSFICPEETVFNQESFTCMRREDMNIDCEDSDKYYELNGNFGMTDEDINKEHNNMVSGNIESTQAPLKPQIAQEQANTVPTSSSGSDTEVAYSKPKPIPNKQKPVRIPKPNRRKPAQSIHPQTKPVPILPLRKMPTVVKVPIKSVEVPALQEPSQIYDHPEASETAEIIVQPEKTLLLENTPTSPVLKNIESKPQPEISAVVTNDPEPEQLPLAEAPVENPVLPVELQKETILPTNDSPNVIDTAVDEHQQEELLAPNESIDISVEPTKHEPEPELELEPVPELKPQALPIVEESTKTDVVQQPIEVFEEIPAVISESEINEASVEEQLGQESAPLHVSEDIKPNEEIQSVEKLEQPLLSPSIFEENSEEASAISNTQTSQAIEPIEQYKNDEESKKPEPLVSGLEEENPTKPEQLQENVMMEPTPEQTENLKHTVGGFKPVDPEMAAEAEALITDFLNTLMKSESSNAKPIMPADLAQQVSSTVTEGEKAPLNIPEAEKTNEEKETDAEVNENESNLNENDIKLPSEAVNVSQEEEIVKKEEELPEGGNKLLTEVQDQHVKDLIGQFEDGPVEQPVDGEVALDKNELVLQQLKTDTSSSNVEPVPNVMMNSFPAEMYQIPVKVIQTTDDLVQPIEKTEEKINTEQKLEANVEIPAYKPISIDDIVELVKERLDQLPEKEQPIELILQPVQEESIKSENPPNPDSASEILESAATVDEVPLVNQETNLKLSLTDTEVDEQPEQPEEIILPIYHRTTGAEADLLKTHEPQLSELNEINANTNIETHDIVEKATQTEDADHSVVAEKNEDDSEITAVADSIETKVKSGRLYRSRSIKNAKMDPRKRRFLFRSDAS